MFDLGELKRRGKQMGTMMSVDYLSRLHYSRSMKRYKLSGKNEGNKRTISVTKKAIVHAHITPQSMF
jgi:hypothetical protein